MNITSFLSSYSPKPSPKFEQHVWMNMQTAFINQRPLHKLWKLLVPITASLAFGVVMIVAIPTLQQHYVERTTDAEITELERQIEHDPVLEELYQ